MPGVLPSRHGRLLGGVIDGRLAKPSPQVKVTASVDLLNAGAFVSVPIDPLHPRAAQAHAGGELRRLAGARRVERRGRQALRFQLGPSAAVCLRTRSWARAPTTSGPPGIKSVSMEFLLCFLAQLGGQRGAVPSRPGESGRFWG